MKKTIVFLSLLFFSLFLTFSLTTSTPAFAKTIKLNYSIFFPATHGQYKEAALWAKEIEKRTGGRVKITLYPGGTLTSAPQCYDGVVNGISDIGMSVFAYTRGRFPVMEACDLPLGYPDGKTATLVVNKFYQTFHPKELSDVKVLYLHAHGPGLLHTKKEVRKLEDLRGLKIRSTGLSAKIVKALGAVPVAMPQGQTYEALKKGVVDGTFGPMEVLKGWRQAEVIHYTIKDCGIGYTTTMFVVMNLKKWSKLPSDIKQVFEEVSKEWIPKHGEMWDSNDKEGEKYTLSLGNKIIELPNSEAEQWQKAVRKVINEYISNATKKGFDGNKYVETLQNYIKSITSEK